MPAAHFPSPPLPINTPLLHCGHLITPILIRRNQKPPRRLAPVPRNRIPVGHQDEILGKPPLLLVPRIRAQNQRPRHRHEHHDAHPLRGLAGAAGRQQLRRRREAVVGVEDVGVEGGDVVAHGGGGGARRPWGWGWGRGGGGGALLGEEGVVFLGRGEEGAVDADVGGLVAGGAVGGVVVDVEGGDGLGVVEGSVEEGDKVLGFCCGGVRKGLVGGVAVVRLVGMAAYLRRRPGRAL
jgi:hypothetical protein